MTIRWIHFFAITVCFSSSVLSQAKPVSSEIIVKWQSAVIPEKASRATKSLLDSSRVENLSNKLSNASKESAQFQNLFILRTSAMEGEALLRELENNPDVEYASWNNWFKSDDFIPNDPGRDSTYWIELIRANKAWDLQKGTPKVVIGVLDTGIDYNHEDLKNQLWINAGETGSDGQGLDKRTNGKDDDGNGFADDWRGWDFVDAPSFDDGGDFKDIDNDPFDENGHGTAVSGIIAAEGNNRRGSIGLAFGCRVMAVRAGGKSGFLQEDDIAQSIIYAASNGARVINMSFGDVEFSPLLRDAIQFAYSRGCILVGSSGNGGVSSLHYPSSFDEVISVGATDAGDSRADFSNYGATLDVMAPGVNVYSTRLGGGYDYFSGTSASAPMVSALAALVVSQNQSLTNEQVKGILLASTSDLGDKGWDPFYAAGRVDAFRALKIPYGTIAKINSPATNSGFTDSLTLYATAAGALMEYFSIFIGIGNNPQTWQMVYGPDSAQKIADSIITIRNLEDGSYTLRLAVQNKDRTTIEDRARIIIDHSPPLIFNAKILKMTDASQYGYLVAFDTDDYCSSELLYRPRFSSDNFSTLPIQALANHHIVFFSNVRGSYEVFLRGTATTGYTAEDHNGGNNYILSLNDPDIPTQTLILDTTLHLPPAYILNRTVDFDRDGKKELVVNELNANGAFSVVKLYEYDPLAVGQLRVIKNFGFNGIPRDANDRESSHKLAIGSGSYSTIYEGDSIPTAITYRDTNDFWISKFGNTEGDSLVEAVYKSGKRYGVIKQSGFKGWTNSATFTNPSPRSNLIGIPGSAVGDFDGDGKPEILMGDYDGDVYIYEREGSTYTPTWRDSLPLVEVSGFLGSGDFDGDGTPEFVVGGHTLDATSEAQQAEQYWTFRIYKKSGNNEFVVAWEQNIYGYFSLRDNPSGIGIGDADGDGQDDLFLSLFPNVYGIRFHGGDYQIFWYHENSVSGTVAIQDMNGDGVNEVFINDGEKVSAFRSAGANVLSAPSGFYAVPRDTNKIEAHWLRDPNVDYFKLYRGNSSSALALFSVVSKNASDTVDNSVHEGLSYFYALTSVTQGIESPASVISKAIPNKKPFVLSAQKVSYNQVAVKFSEPIDPNFVFDISSYNLSPIGNPTTAIPAEGGRSAFLTFRNIPVGNYQLRIQGLADADQTPMDSASIAMVFSPDQKLFKVTRCEYLGNSHIKLTFSEAVEKNSSENPANYRLSEGLRLVSVARDNSTPTVVQLKLTGRPFGAYGVTYAISVFGVQSVSGVPLDTVSGNVGGIAFTSESIEHARVYPSPYRGETGGITFGNLPNDAMIKIYSIGGKFLREISGGYAGGITWDVRDLSGNAVPSGIYIYHIISQGKKKLGKLAIVR